MTTFETYIFVGMVTAICVAAVMIIEYIVDSIQIKHEIKKVLAEEAEMRKAEDFKRMIQMTTLERQ